MKALIIILIVLLIVQTAIFVWCDLLQFLRGKREAILQETIKNVHQDFMAEKERLRELIDERDKVINLLRSELRDERHRVSLLERQLEIRGYEHSEVEKPNFFDDFRKSDSEQNKENN